MVPADRISSNLLTTSWTPCFELNSWTALPPLDVRVIVRTVAVSTFVLCSRTLFLAFHVLVCRAQPGLPVSTRSSLKCCEDRLDRSPSQYRPCRTRTIRRAGGARHRLRRSTQPYVLTCMLRQQRLSGHSDSRTTRHVQQQEELDGTGGSNAGCSRVNACEQGSDDQPYFSGQSVGVRPRSSSS